MINPMTTMTLKVESQNSNSPKKLQIVRRGTDCGNGGDAGTRADYVRRSNLPDTEVVDRDNCDPEDGDEHPGIDLIAVDPVLYDERAGRQLIWRDNDVFEPVGVTRPQTLDSTWDSQGQ